MTKVIKISVVTILSCLILGIAVSPALFAKDSETESGSSDTSTSGRNRTTETRLRTEEQSHTETENEAETETEIHKSADSRLNPEERLEIARQRLDDRKKVVCEKHQDQINTRMNNVNERSQNHFNRIDQIFTATVTFYEDKGLAVNNYDQLVAKVTETKTAAETALHALQDTPKFSCESDGPKADIQTFLNLRLNKVSTFEAYRDAVKEFVKAVRTAAETAASSTEEQN